MNKKKYFKNKLIGVQNMIWDLEFKSFKTQEIREEVLVNYDDSKLKLTVVDEKIKLEKDNKKMSTDEFKRLEDSKVLLEKDIKRYENQMAALDLEVFGSRPTNELPDGAIGITHQIDSLRELSTMIKDYIKSI